MQKHLVVTISTIQKSMLGKTIQVSNMAGREGGTDPQSVRKRSESGYIKQKFRTRIRAEGGGRDEGQEAENRSGTQSGLKK